MAVESGSKVLKNVEALLLQHPAVQGNALKRSKTHSATQQRVCIDATQVHLLEQRQTNNFGGSGLVGLFKVS